MPKTSALIVDDEPDLIELVSLALNQMDVHSIGASTLAQAREKIASHQVNFCLTDMQLPDGNGLDLVREIRANHPHIPVAVITAYGNMDKAVESLKAGAFDYVAKPLDIEVLRKMVRQAANLNNAMTQDQTTGTQTCSSILDSQLIGRSQPMNDLKQKIQKVAQSQAPIFIQGESGTGKEVVARCIHELSSRKNGPFIAVNCGAIPSELIESELFGHKKGSFSGAIKDKIGLFEAAEGGTLFLDEVADLPLQMQVKLLRVIQEKKIRAIGDNHEKNVDCRLLSATHKNLDVLIQNNLFRGDLYYRINVIQIVTPPLRQRDQDVIIIAKHLLKSLSSNLGTPFQLSSTSVKLLIKHQFPGNVRELQNSLQRACALCDSDIIEPHHLQLDTQSFGKDTTLKTENLGDNADLNSVAPNNTPSNTALLSNNSATSSLIQNDQALDAAPETLPVYDPHTSGSLEDYLIAVETHAIRKALAETHWNRTAAAKLLGLSFRSLRYRLKKLGLDD